jgi:small subunit ribosomal protein S6
MNQYDVNLILNPNLSSEQVATERSYTEETIKAAGAEVISLQELGNRRLAYPIQKDREGYLMYFTIKAAGNPLKSIGDTLRLRDHIRRVLIVRDHPEWKTKKD